MLVDPQVKSHLCNTSAQRAAAAQSAARCSSESNPHSTSVATTKRSPRRSGTIWPVSCVLFIWFCINYNMREPVIFRRIAEGGALGPPCTPRMFRILFCRAQATVAVSGRASQKLALSQAEKAQSTLPSLLRSLRASHRSTATKAPRYAGMQILMVLLLALLTLVV